MQTRFGRLFIFVFICLPGISPAQQSPPRDTAGVQVQQATAEQSLQNVTVHAFEQHKQLKEVSAAVSIINTDQLNRYSNTSLVPALNATPGVRMEERSPGSYRINVRGSTLRSPFGVRNVKVYWNDIPLTDPGGNTYLNQLSFFNTQSIEIIKGPAGSVYGAGTGGAMLISSMPAQWQQSVTLNYTAGSYHTQAFNAGIQAGSEDRKNLFNFTHQSGDGYRYHTAMRRDIGTWETVVKASDKQELSANFLYGDLYYQTPGALTLAEYNKDPRAFRPASGGFGNADQVKAAIYQKMVLAGITNKYTFSPSWENSTTVYGAFVQFSNPTFRAYEQRSEPQFGGRTVFTFSKQWRQTQLQWVMGGEAQRGFFNTKDFSNKQGNPDTLQTDDDIGSWIYEVFAQANLRLPGNWDITAGASFNQFHVSDHRLSDPSLPLQQRTYSNQLAPRLAVSKKIISQTWLYGSVAKGFSPPAIAEVLPPSRTISTSLNAETGFNYELGVKSSWLNNRLYTEVNAFYFRLQNAIVQRTAVNAANYYVNAGHTQQKGLEAQFNYLLFTGRDQLFSTSRLWTSFTYNDFRYDDFKQLNADYSGNRMPSVAKNTVAAGLDLATKLGLYLNLTYYYSDPIPMNDANTDFASSYNLLGGRLGYKRQFSSLLLNVFAGVDNLFDVRYSLGNDINAAGGRYYNAAPGRNYFAGLSFSFVSRKGEKTL